MATAPPPIRVYRGKGNYVYVTAIGDFRVKGRTGDWNVYRGGGIIANVQLLGEVETIIDTMIKGARERDE